MTRLRGRVQVGFSVSSLCIGKPSKASNSGDSPLDKVHVSMLTPSRVLPSPSLKTPLQKNNRRCYHFQVLVTQQKPFHTFTAVQENHFVQNLSLPQRVCLVLPKHLDELYSVRWFSGDRNRGGRALRLTPSSESLGPYIRGLPT